MTKYKIGIFIIILALLVIAIIWFSHTRGIVQQTVLTEEQKQAFYELGLRTVEDMVFVEGGTFMMGPEFVGDRELEKAWGIDHLDWISWEDEWPAHKVRVDSFYINRYLTRFSDYYHYAKLINHQEVLSERENQLDVVYGDSKPATTLSWYQAKGYCQWLGELTGLPIDLPSEAEWEYAARSRGQNVLYATDTGFIEEGHNFIRLKTKGIMGGVTYPPSVGTPPPNPLGLYEMTGSISQWVDDWYDENYYSYSPVDNPTGPSLDEISPHYNDLRELQPDKKVLRGGGIYSGENGARVFTRWKLPPGFDDGVSMGIRCALHSDLPKADLMKIAEENLAKLLDESKE